ncbi:MAG: SIR2 family protein [Gemmatimonadota bacterium]|nr:SIR2 family protein [Gemmatimonadota bacterium]
MPIRVISDQEAIRQILGSPDRYAIWLGAGASAEAGVKTAQAICEQIRDELVSAESGIDRADPAEVARWANARLAWSDTSRRYVTCIREGYRNEARRVEYFRDILRDLKPAFCHHAAALLMRDGYLKRTCLTTNFDHLLEDAFTQLGITGCQPLRGAADTEYWQDRQERYFVVKLHGDIDTHNILNTREETIAIDDGLQGLVDRVLRNAGLVVLGTAGNEKSVRALFDAIGRRPGTADVPLSFGLLWGVYMGAPKPARISNDELRERVAARISETETNRDVTEMIGDARNDLFCFFPVWGAGQFMHDLVQATGNRPLVATAARHLDHEMRLRRIFTQAGLSDDAVGRHLQSLRQGRASIGKRGGGAVRPPPETVLVASHAPSATDLRVIYGDISSRSLMGADEFAPRRRAVVSPEDTCISAGGGVAYALLQKAGPEIILHELAKFSKIPQRTVAVTSGGNLPVHHIFHAATIEIAPDATYVVTPEDVRATTAAALVHAAALDVGALWTPLLAAGVASMQPRDSFRAILEAVDEQRVRAPRGDAPPLTISVVIYREKDLPRHVVLDTFTSTLGTTFTVSA